MVSLESVPTIATGMRPNELMVPFHPRLNQAQIAAFHQYLSTRPEVYARGSNGEAETVLEQLAKKHVHFVKLVGAYANSCVSAAIVKAMEMGFTVYSPTQAVLDYDMARPFEADVQRRVDFHNETETIKIVYQYKLDDNIHCFTPLNTSTHN